MSAVALIEQAAPVEPGRPEAWAPLIRAAFGASVRGIVETGRLLAEAKAALEHGEWGRLCDELLPFDQRTAQRLMMIASHERLSDPTHASHLPPSWTTLESLARLPVETFDEAVEKGVINPSMERRAAQRLARAGSVAAFVAAPPPPAREAADPEAAAVETAAALVKRLLTMRVPAAGLDRDAVAMIEAVATVARCSVEAMFGADRLHGDERWRAVTARRLAIYMLHIECEMSQPQAARPFGLESSGASFMAKDFEDFRDEASFARMIDRICETQRAYLEDGQFE